MTAVLAIFLQSRYRAIERLQITQSLKLVPFTSRLSHRTGTKVSKASHSTVATQLQCSLCKESHRLFKCDKFLQLHVQQRLSYVKYSTLCFNCLKPFTRKHTCSNQVCRRCHNSYHTWYTQMYMLDQLIEGQQIIIDLQVQRTNRLQG